MKEFIEKIDHHITNVLNVIAALLLLLMVIVVIRNIFYRYILGQPLIAGGELARYLMVYLVMLAAPIGLRKGGHPALLFIIEKFPKRFRKVWFLILDIFIFIILVYIFRFGLEKAIDNWTMKTPALRIRYFWVNIALPIGAVFMMIELVLKNILVFVFNYKVPELENK